MTIPVTSQVKPRGGSYQNSKLADEDSMNQSYAFDYNEDKRARAADRRGQASNNSNNNSSSQHNGESYPVSPRKVQARNKMRQLEHRFGSSAPTGLSVTGSNSTTTTDSHLKSPTRNNNRSYPSRPPNLEHTHNSSDDSIQFSDLENQRPMKIASKAHSKKNNQSLNALLGSNHNHNNDNHNHNSSKGRLRSSSSVASKASRDSSNHTGGTTTTGTRRKVQVRDTDRLLRPGKGGGGRGGLERRDSGIMMRTGNASSPAMVLRRSNSFGGTTSSSIGRSSTERGGGSSSVSGDASIRSSTGSTHTTARQPPMTRQGSKTMGPRSRSMSVDRRPPQTMTTRPNMAKRRSRSQSLDRGGGGGGKHLDNASVHSASQNTILTELSQPKVIQRGDSTVILLPVTQEQAKQLPLGTQKAGSKNIGTVPFLANGSFYPSYFPRKIPPMEEVPPKSLVLIWIVVSAELAFDLATTVIAFMSLVEEDSCCGERIELGPIPMTITTPFFLLVIAELAFLFRAMILTMWPSIFTGESTDEDREIRASRGFWVGWLCCCLRWKAKIILKILNFLVLMNPFFGCIIAWMLLYQSDKVESFVVLGLEGASIILHFISVYLEGSCKTWGQFFCHCIPLLPFAVSVTLILLYLKQGGVCYSVDSELFLFTGCELCENGYPPVDNQCLIDGINVTVATKGLFDFNDVQDFSDVEKALTKRVDQGEFCGNQRDDGPDMNFCFYTYN